MQQHHGTLSGLDAPLAGSGMHKRMLHKRQRATSAEPAATTTAARTTRRRATTARSTETGTAVFGAVTDLLGPGASSPHSSALNALSTASSAPIAASTTASTATAGLPQGAIYGIAIGGGVLGAAILAGIGYCCWKKRKARANDDDLGWNSLKDGAPAGAAGGSGGIIAGRPIRVLGAHENDGAWASTDSLKASPYGDSEKPWAQHSLASLSSTVDEKSWVAPLPSQPNALPVFAPRDLGAARAELLGMSPASMARSGTESSLASSIPAVGRGRPTTDAYSVNDIISFSGQNCSRSMAQYPPSSLANPQSPAPAHLPPRATATPPPSVPPQPLSQYPAAPATPQQGGHVPPQHFSLNGVPVGPQPITAAHYPPRRPSRPSEVPSMGAPASPYNFARRPEAAQRDTQELARDERLEERFKEILLGGAGEEQDRREEGQAHEVTQLRERSKKDTILGLTDVYAGEEEDPYGGEEGDWDEPVPSAAEPDVRPPQRTTSRKRVSSPPPTSASFPLPPQPAVTTMRDHPPLTNVRRHSTRVDSKPLRELEAMFAQPHYAARASEASDLSGLAAAAGVTIGGGRGVSSYRVSDASSVLASPARPHHSPTTAPLSFTRRPLGSVPESDSKDSLSPYSAATGGAHSPYGEAEKYQHSIHSAAGEVGELSSSSLAGSTTSSPARPQARGLGIGLSRSTSSLTGSPLGTPSSERQPKLAPSALGISSHTTLGDEKDDDGTPRDVFGSIPAVTIQPPARKSSVKLGAARLQRKSSTRPSPPAPLRLARSASLAGRQVTTETSSPTPPSPPVERNPLTVSAAERDVLAQLGLPPADASPSPLTLSPLASGDRTPDLTLSGSDLSPCGSSSPFTPDTSVLDTPQSPVFHLSRSSAPFMDVTPSPSPAKSTFAPIAQPLPTTAAKQQSKLLEPLATEGFDSLESMAAMKRHSDVHYRSATESIYGSYA
ncbi:hypothetical protein Rhopal_001396-T1 [Rhodotorula paludigena]|uniref:Proteophosphoglycan ppg4 n=1 Tax=Rhodotorula paludigena TaxID=86838 RepID=A0AAV5G7G1_9BASI|nr:hypothetical protein Rhopal_001396-T1 [Rhodotorula paludigena]